MRLNRRFSWRHLLIALAIVSCTTDAPTGPVFRVSTLSITGGTPDGVLVTSTSTRLSLEARAVTGALLTGRPVVWRTNDASIATVTDSGVVTARAVGIAVVTAEAEGQTATRYISVREGFIPPATGVGTLSASALGDSVRLVMPAGAIPDTLRALHVRLSTASLPDARILKTYEFGPAGSQFSSPLTLRVRYNPAAVTPSRERSQLRLFGVEGGVWTELPDGRVDTLTHEVIAPVTHFSQYAVFRRAMPAKAVLESWVAPSPLYSGQAIGGVKGVRVLDSLDRGVPRALVRFAIVGGAGVLEGPDTARTDSSGRATFAGTWRSGPTPAANVLRASVDDYPAATAAQFAVSSVLRPPVIVVDVDSIMRTGVAASVTPDPWVVGISNGGEIPLSGLSIGTISYSAGAPDWLSATFNGDTTTAPTSLTLLPNIAGLKAGTYTASVPLQTAGAGVAPVTLTFSMVLGQAPPVALVITSPAAGIISGGSFSTQPVIRVEDAFGDRVTGAALSVRVRVSPVTCPGECAATLRGDTVVTSVDGTAPFTNLRLDGYGGPFTLTFSSGTITSAVQSPVTIVQETRSLSIVTQPRGAIANAALDTQPTLHSLDAAGLRVRGGTASVTASLATGSGTLSGTVTRSAVDGIVAFTNLAVSQASAGASIRFTQPSNGAEVLSAAFNVLTPARIVLSPDSVEFVGTAAGAQPSPRTVALTNSGQQPLNGLVAGTIAYGAGAANWLTAAFVGGITTASTSLTLTPNITGIKQGVYTARVPISSSVSGVPQDTIVVVLRLAQAPAVRVGVVTPLSGAVSGLSVSQAPVVRIEDAFGDRVLGAAVSLTLRRVAVTCPTGCQSSLLGDTTITSVDGLASFAGLRLDGFGPIGFEVSAPGLTTATLPAVTIVQQEVGLSIASQPLGAIAGAPFDTQPVVHVIDAAGLRVRGSTASVGATIATGAGVLIGTATRNAVDGVVTFAGIGVTLPSAGASLRFTQVSNGAQVVSASFDVLSPAAIVFSADSVEMLGTAAATAPSPVTVSLTNGGQQSLTGLSLGAISYGAGATGWLTANFTAGVTSAPTSIVLTPNASGLKQGTYTARVPVSSTTPGVASDTIAVVLRLAQAPAVRVTLSTPMTGVLSGALATQQPIVRIEDAFGDRVLGSVVPVTMRRVSVSCPSGCSSTIVGDTVVAAIDGIATFTGLRLDGYGPLGLEFTAPGLTSASQASVTIVQQPVALTLVTQPTGATENVVFSPQPVVHIVDAAGLRIRGSTDTITATLELGSGALLGTLSRAAVDGAATFSNLAISQYNASARLRFTQPATGTSVLSATFPVASIIATFGLSPDTLRLSSLAQSSLVSVDARDAGGALIASPRLSWRSLNPLVATVDTTGLIRSVADGTTKVIAEIANLADTVVVVVAQVPASVVLTPDTLRFSALTDTVRVAGVIRDAVGSVVAGVVTYSSLDAPVATVSTGGLVTAVGVGNARIVATFGALSDTAYVQVTQVPATITIASDTLRAASIGDTVTASVTVRDARGVVSPSAAVSWNAVGPAVTLLAAPGQVQALGNGNALLIATSGAVSDTAVVIVRQVAAAATVAADTVRFGAVGSRRAIGFAAADARGVPIVRTPVYGFGAPGIAAVATDTITSVANGTTVLTITEDTVARTVAILVAQVPVSLVATPDTLWMSAFGDTLLVSAVVRDSNAVAIPSAIAFVSSDTTVAVVLADGRVIARGNGSVVVSASSGVLADSAVTLVQQVPVSLVASVDSLAFATLGRADTLSAVVRDARGSPIAGTTTVWTSLAPGIATIDAAGIVTAVGNGLASLTAVVGGIADTVPVRIQQVARALLLNADTVRFGAIGRTRALVASVADSGGTVFGAAPVVWSSGTPSVAQVDTAGTVTASANGQAVIVATSGAAKDTVFALVQQVPAVLLISPASVVLPIAGARDTLVAAVADSASVTMGASGTTWQSANTAVASVTAAGEVTATGVGTTYIRAVAGALTDSAQVTVLGGAATGSFLHVYASDVDGDFEIVRRDNLAAPRQVLTSNSVSDTDPSFSPDGTRIVFTSQRDGNDELYVMNADGSSPERRTTYSGVDRSPSWSPDGQYIAFVRDDQLYVMRADGSGVRRLTTVGVDHPDWINETTIAFGYRGVGIYRISVTSVENGYVPMLVVPIGGIFEPAVSHDRSVIMVKHGNGNLYLLPVNGGALSAPVTTTGNEGSPTWLPGDSLVLSTRLVSGKQRLFRISVATGVATLVSDTTANALAPGRVPDTPAPGVGEVASMTLTMAGSVVVPIDSTRALTAVLRDYAYRTVTGSVTWQTSNAAVATVTNGVLTAVGVGEVQVWAEAANGRESNLIKVWVPPRLTAPIVWSSRLDGDYEVYRALPDRANLTAGRTKLTNNSLVDEGEPSYAPDVSRIVFSSNRDGNYELYTADTSGASPVRLTNYVGSDEAPRWSPNGQYIAFVRDGQLYVMNGGGTNVRRLSASSSSRPDWLNDTTIVFGIPNAGIFRTTVGAAENQYTQVYSGCCGTFEAGVSHDRSRIVLRHGNGNLYTMTATGGAFTTLTTGGADQWPTWLPGDSIIVFVRSTTGVTGEANELWSIRADGADLVRLTDNAVDDRQPTARPANPTPAVGDVGSVTLTMAGSVVVPIDSTRTLTAVLRDYAYRTVAGSVTWQTSNPAVATVTNGVLTAVGVGDAQVWAEAANGRASNRITVSVPPNNAGFRVWQIDSTGTNQLYRSRMDGTQRTRLTNSGFDDQYPAVSPDGAKILFSSNRDGNQELYRMNSDGTGVVRLTNSTVQDNSPAWSADGSHIAWVRDGQLWVMRADTTQRQALYTSTPVARPRFAGDSTIFFGIQNTGVFRQKIGSVLNAGHTSVWSTCCGMPEVDVSPNGLQLAVRHGSGSIYLMGLDGSNNTQLAFGAFSYATWTRNGEWIVTSKSNGSTYDLWLLRPDGSLQMQLTRGTGNNLFPDTSP